VGDALRVVDVRYSQNDVVNGRDVRVSGESRCADEDVSCSDRGDRPNLRGDEGGVVKLVAVSLLYGVAGETVRALRGPVGKDHARGWGQRRD
jgi:hypothetical protein